MILTVALNPAVDKTYLLPGFDPLGINRAREVLAVAGGKANNVARVLVALGAQVRATGFLAGDAGRWIDRQLQAAGVESRFVEVAGETRTCLALIDPGAKSVCEIREPGPEICEKDQERLLTLLGEVAPGGALAVLSGSLPRGVAPAYVGQLVNRLRMLGVPVLLDMGGAALKAGVEAGPLLIKPNLEELADLVGHSVAPREAGEAARQLAERWGVIVVASLGKDGAVVLSPGGDRFHVQAPEVDAVNTVGAGDSLLAGLAAALAEGHNLEDAVRSGIACGTASTLTMGVAVVRKADADAMLPRVEVRR